MELTQIHGAVSHGALQKKTLGMKAYHIDTRNCHPWDLCETNCNSHVCWGNFLFGKKKETTNPQHFWSFSWKKVQRSRPPNKEETQKIKGKNNFLEQRSFTTSFLSRKIFCLWFFFNNKTARNGLEMNCSRQGTWCSPRNYGSRGTWKYRFVIPTFIRYKKDMIPTSLWCFLPTTNTPFLFFGDRGASQWWRVHRLKTSFHSNHHKLTHSNPAQCSEKFRGQFGEFLM